MKNLLTIFLLAFFPIFASAQSYDQLWKNVTTAQNKDLPKTEIAVLDKIVAKAKKENNYGQLLAAGLQRGSAQVNISPDSLKNEISRLENEALTTKNPAAKAVCYAILGDIYKQNEGLGNNHEAKSKEYWQKAMADPDALAKANAKGYEPIVGKGEDSKIFGDDLLHVVGKLTGDYATMNKYYSEHGNRAAACLTAYNPQSGYGEDKLMATLDSIINVYGDLDVCAEIAIERYQNMPTETNAERKAKYEYGEKVLSHWPSWQNINSVKNGQASLTQPTLFYRADASCTIPNKEQTVRFKAINVSDVTLTLTRLNIDGDTNLNPENDNDLKKLKASRIASSKVTVSKRVKAEYPYYEVEDSISIPKLPVGVWLMEWNFEHGTLNFEHSTLNPQHSTFNIYRVSNVSLISESLPEKKFRYVVVNATTGKPIAKAHLRLTQERGYGKSPVVNNLTADGKGEAMFTSTENRGITAWAYTDDDKAAPTDNQWGTYYKNGKQTSRDVVDVFTDRSIYRPGQNVHAVLIVYSKDDNNYTRKAVEGRSVKLTLRDANYKDVESKTVTTDKFGSASADFALPSSGLTGRFSISANADGGNGSTSFNVEEYKRPTFEVKFDDYKESYKAGDTITVTGHAKTYSGVAVQGAKVEYTVNRRNAWWWRWYGDDEEGFSYSGTATTDADGNFKVRVPLVLPSEDMDLMNKGKRLYHYYNMAVSAKVTDVGGESHEGFMSLPLGTNPTALSCDLPDKILKDSLKTIKFTRTNMAGKEIEGTVSYSIEKDGNEIAHDKADCGKAVEISKLQSGAYSMLAVCGTDTLKKDFVVFSVSDKCPVVKTHDWFWQSAGQFPNDGKPVYVQFGSSDIDQHIVYTLISGKNKVLEQGSIDKSNELTTREFKYKDEYGDGLVLSVAWVRDGVTYTHRAEIRRPLKNDHLRLSWKTFRNNLVPGQKEEWTLTVLSPDGKPANAQLMATLYDKSLDQIRKHDWDFSPNFYIYLPNTSWSGLNDGDIYGLSLADISFGKTKDLAFRSILRDYYDDLLYNRAFYRGIRIRGSRGNVMLAADAPQSMRANSAVKYKKQEADQAEPALEEVVVSSVADTTADDYKETDKGVQLRENLNETAFFYPQLTTDNDGNVSMKFTLPEAVTTWRFMGLAHDADINYGLITDEAVAKKTIMVQPNMPRFIRQGDKAQIATRIFNTSDKPVSGKVRLEILDPMTEKVLYTEESTFNADSNATVSKTFSIDFSESIGNQKSPLGGDLVGNPIYIVRVTASVDGFSDGEQHYLPVLPNTEFVTNTYPFTQVGKGTKTIDLKDVVPAGVKNAKVKFEYTNNPTWLMIQALPYVSNPSDKDAISLVTAYYANSIAKNIMNSDPKIKNVFEQWRREASLLEKDGRGGSFSLQSNLEKDQELKSLVLSETPWVADADDESAQKRALGIYFDENTINNQLSTIYTQLKNLQNPDGSFSWWQGMDGSFYVTVEVAKILARLGSTPTLLEKDGRGGSLSLWAFLDASVPKQVAELKRLEKKGVKVVPSDALCDYVYASALAKRKSTADIDYIVNLLAKMPRNLTIYGKANSAVILAMYGRTKVANEYLQSINEYSVYKEEMGRYFDTNKAQYSWFDYKIPTQTAAIEAYKLLEPNDTKTITEMQRWLLQEKRTQAWDTPLNSASAIYAFMDNKENSLAERESSKLFVNGKEVELPQGTAGVGYVKKELGEELRVKSNLSEEGRVKSEESNSSSVEKTSDNTLNNLTVEKTSDGVSWGAVYAQFFQPTKDIKAISRGLTVKRELLDSKGNPLNSSLGEGSVGSKVKVRITITADRDYDFVQVIDKRAACLEPVNQVSGYCWGYYITPRDYTTNYYFDRMAKGTHVVETEYYIDRAGDYTSGTCTAQCAYSPEFMGRALSEELRVKSDESN